MASSIMNFIEENYQSLLWFAVRMTGNWADGEDVLQTVATKICLKQDELKDIAHCKSYLMVCIRNATINQRRTKARQRVADESYEKHLFRSRNQTGIRACGVDRDAGSSSGVL